MLRESTLRRCPVGPTTLLCCRSSLSSAHEAYSRTGSTQQVAHAYNSLRQSAQTLQRSGSCSAGSGGNSSTRMQRSVCSGGGVAAGRKLSSAWNKRSSDTANPLRHGRPTSSAMERKADRSLQLLDVLQITSYAPTLSRSLQRASTASSVALSKRIPSTLVVSRAGGESGGSAVKDGDVDASGAGGSSSMLSVISAITVSSAAVLAGQQMMSSDEAVEQQQRQKQAKASITGSAVRPPAEAAPATADTQCTADAASNVTLLPVTSAPSSPSPLSSTGAAAAAAATTPSAISTNCHNTPLVNHLVVATSTSRPPVLDDRYTHCSTAFTGTETPRPPNEDKTKAKRTKDPALLRVSKADATELAGALDRLQKELPDIFSDSRHFSIYSDDVVLENQMHPFNYQTKGLPLYRTQASMLQVKWKMMCSDLEFHLLSCEKVPEESTVVVRWKVVGCPRWLAGRKATPERLRYLEGLSTFEVNGLGQVRRHKVTKIRRDGSRLYMANVSVAGAMALGLAGLKKELCDNFVRVFRR